MPALTSCENVKAAWTARLARAGQAHLLDWWDELTAEQRDDLLTQLEQFDFDHLKRLFHDEAVQPEIWSRARAIRRLPYIPAADTIDGSPAAERARRRGEGALRAGRVAVILVAGGQGTRLGSSRGVRTAQERYGLEFTRHGSPGHDGLVRRLAGTGGRADSPPRRRLGRRADRDQPVGGIERQRIARPAGRAPRPAILTRISLAARRTKDASQTNQMP